MCARGHQTCDFRKRATSAPAEGPAYGLDFARHCEFPFRALQAQKRRVSQKSHVWCRPIRAGAEHAAVLARTRPSPAEHRWWSAARVFMPKGESCTAKTLTGGAWTTRQASACSSKQVPLGDWQNNLLLQRGRKGPISVSSHCSPYVCRRCGWNVPLRVRCRV